MSSNLLSHFYTIQTFLPAMLEEERGTIVTVGSVLGYLGCANLGQYHLQLQKNLAHVVPADYSASKAALIAFHASLQAELRTSEHPGAEHIRTIFVAPGQLGTAMFAGVKTPSNFLAPVVQPVELAREIVQMIDDGESGDIRLPFYARWAPVMSAFPVSIQALAKKVSGMDQAMLNYSKLKKA
jgi:NAD(P)-dependent dehydrogenase (short-subunit alcohol dehydrogenase family)